MPQRGTTAGAAPAENEGMMVEPAQAQLVKLHLDWGRVKQRLELYPNIARYYDLGAMRKWEKKPPYYCHYLAWRMGTWPHEDPFCLLDSLIGECSQIAGWSGGRLENGRFDNFWSHIWELQVGEAFARVVGKKNVQWLAEGPDLVVQAHNRKCFVECYVWRKGYAAAEYACDVLRRVLSWPYFAVRDTTYPPEIPSDRECQLLHDLLLPFLSAQHVRRVADRMSSGYPLKLDFCGARIVMEDSNATAAAPDLDNAYPAFEDMAARSILEAVRAKTGSNCLAAHRPNALLVNRVIVREASEGEDHMRATGGDLMPFCCAANEIDAVVLYDCGVTNRLDLAQGRIWVADHPLTHWIGSLRDV